MARARRLSIHTPNVPAMRLKSLYVLYITLFGCFYFIPTCFSFPLPASSLFCKCRENPLPM